MEQERREYKLASCLALFCTSLSCAKLLRECSRWKIDFLMKKIIIYFLSFFFFIIIIIFRVKKLKNYFLLNLPSFLFGTIKNTF
jgi:hypothetical protein